MQSVANIAFLELLFTYLFLSVDKSEKYKHLKFNSSLFLIVGPQYSVAEIISSKNSMPPSLVLLCRENRMVNRFFEKKFSVRFKRIFLTNPNTGRGKQICRSDVFLFYFLVSDLSKHQFIMTFAHTQVSSYRIW